MPYDTIIALNEKGAVLHYHGKRDKVRNGKTLLIDAGARFAGYASDITRTYAVPEAHPVFHALLKGMNQLQQATCAAVKPGLSYEPLHGKAQADIAALLLETGILRKVSHAQAVEQNLAAPFFPHGLGHQLGIFVHDVAGKQLDRTGKLSPPSKYKYLRTNRVLGEGNLITVEPGLYFIEMLLAPLRANAATTAFFDWQLIEALKPLGGIRVEDDVLVTATGHRNLTREQLPD
jgi:Xaa-Pro dipeptidase